MGVRFPSVGFFEALRSRMTVARDRFSRLGFFDTTFGVRVGNGTTPNEFSLTFEVFDCTAVREGVRQSEVDFVIEGPAAAWREMLDNIHALGAADTTHSLNTLTHFGEHLRLCYDDPDGHDKMYRFAESIQAFFDLSAEVDFDYADSTRPPGRATAAERRVGA